MMKDESVGLKGFRVKCEITTFQSHKYISAVSYEGLPESINPYLIFVKGLISKTNSAINQSEAQNIAKKICEKIYSSKYEYEFSADKLVAWLESDTVIKTKKINAKKLAKDLLDDYKHTMTQQYKGYTFPSDELIKFTINQFATYKRMNPDATDLFINETFSSFYLDGLLLYSKAIEFRAFLSVSWSLPRKSYDDSFSILGNTKPVETFKKLLEEKKTIFQSFYSVSFLDKKLLEQIKKNDVSIGRDLNLGSLHLNDDDVKLLCEALGQNTTVTAIRLYSNVIGPKGAENLVTLKGITELDVTFNRIGDDGIMVLAQHKGLVALEAENNGITDVGANAFIKALQTNYGLTKLLLAGNKISDSNLKTIGQLIQRNRIFQFHLAIQQGDLKKIEYWINQKISLLEVSGSEENSALHWALQSKQIEVVKLLLTTLNKQNIDYHQLKNKQNRTPIDLANALNLQEIATLLQDLQQTAKIKEKITKKIEVLTIADWKDIEVAAEKGDAFMQMTVGVNYYNRKEFTNAVIWLQKAADQDHVRGQLFLGVCYKNGEGVKENPEQAAFWFQKAANQGDSVAQIEFAKCLAQGKGIAKDEKQAFKLYEKVVIQDAKNCYAQLLLGLCYMEGEGTSQDDEKAFKCFLTAANLDDLSEAQYEAQYLVGLCYANGQGVIADIKSAISWLEKAAKQNIPEAQLKLGLLYYEGKKVSQNYKEAVFWLQNAAERKSTHAQRQLAVCYAEGNGITQDYTKTAFWLKEAATLGDPYAQCGLAAAYEQGVGVDKDLKLAKEYYEKAAAQGVSEAKLKLQQSEVGATPFWLSSSGQPQVTVPSATASQSFKH